MIEPPYEYRATVVRWVDGDTVIMDAELGFHVTSRWAFRLLGCNAPEEGKPGYQEAIDFVNKLAPVGTVVLAETHKTEKYGRWLVEVHLDGDAWTTVSAQLIAAGLAVPYFGGTRGVPVTP